MLFFAVSFLLVFISSYFITSIIAPKKNIIGLIYIFIVAFAQIVLTFEILSLFTLIKPFEVLGFNVLFLAGSYYFWNKNSKPIWNLDCEDFKNRINNSLKLDKSLMFLYVGFLVFLFVAIFLCILMPTTNADAYAYHVARSLFWVSQGSLNHFETADIRALCLPINSEILYSWIFLFVKKDVFLGFFSFIGYILSITAVYNILGIMGYCVRKRLWVVFILSSLPCVLVQASGTETDIIIAGLISSCIFLFWYALRNDKKIPVFMASLAYALAIGTKTPALIAIPGVGLALFLLCSYYKKYKPLALFLGFAFLNFLIFSSYNYILNYLHFSNFLGPQGYMIVSKNYYGIRGAISNFIKYLFTFVDVTGFTWTYYLTPYLTKLRGLVLNYMYLGDIPDGTYTLKYFVNYTLLEPIMGAGILGFLVYLPCAFLSLLKPIFKLNFRKNKFILLFSILFWINMFSLSYSLGYMTFSVRFIMFFLVLSSPVLVYSYLSKKNPLKYIIIFFALFYLILVSTHLWPRPFVKIIRIIIEHRSILYPHRNAACRDHEKFAHLTNAECVLKNSIKKNFNKNTNIVIFAPTSSDIYVLKWLTFEGYKIDFKLLENADKIDFNKYNVIISTNRGQTSTVINDYNNRSNDLEMKNGKLIANKIRLCPCIYIKDDKFHKPYQVMCGFGQTFIDKYDITPLEFVGISNKEYKHDEYDYYVIYLNKSANKKSY